MTPQQNDKEKLDSAAFKAVGYRTEESVESKEMRLTFFRDRGQQNVLAYMVLTSSEVYEFAQSLLRSYDKLEGIE